MGEWYASMCSLCGAAWRRAEAKECDRGEAPQEGHGRHELIRALRHLGARYSHFPPVRQQRQAAATAEGGWPRRGCGCLEGTDAPRHFLKPISSQALNGSRALTP